MFRELNYYSLSRYAFTILYYKYKTRARRIKKPFELTKIQFEKLTSSKCSYCGNPPSYLFNRRRRGSKKSYVYNGIDRVDPKKGYIMSNCVSCCGICNKMKGSLDLDSFLKRIKMIYQHYSLPLFYDDKDDV